jgi:hypothetical protein
MNKVRFRWAYNSRAETSRGRGGFGDGGRVCVDRVLNEVALFVQNRRGGVFSCGWKRHGFRWEGEAGLEMG